MADVTAIAIDGGGTRCRAAAMVDGRIVDTASGPANVSTDFGGAVAQIQIGLEALAAKIGCPLSDLVIAPAYVGVAGVTGPDLAARLKAALPFRTVRVEDDRPAALRGALGRLDGAIAHCGTGSFFAAQQDGAMRFAGGWGAALGDEASAQWVGRRALALTLQSVDGRIAATDLTRALLARFEDAPGVVRFAGTAAPQDFGDIAPDVTRHADAGDPVARGIMQAGADDIASGLASIGWKAGNALCLTGGIGPSFAPFLPDAMRAALRPPDGEPLAGALSLAGDVAAQATGPSGGVET